MDLTWQLRGIRNKTRKILQGGASVHSCAPWFLAILVLTLQYGDYQGSERRRFSILSVISSEFLGRMDFTSFALGLFHSLCACSCWILQSHRFFFSWSAWSVKLCLRFLVDASNYYWDRQVSFLPKSESFSPHFSILLHWCVFCCRICLIIQMLMLFGDPIGEISMLMDNTW